MTIRPAVAADVPELVEMGERFVAATPYREHLVVSPQHLAATMQHLIASDSGAIFVAAGAGGDVVGMIGLHVFEHPYSGDRVAAELFWWVEPSRRGRIGLWLLRQAEQWANAVGAVWLQMVAPTPDVEQLYARLGFTPVERAYQRRI